MRVVIADPDRRAGRRLAQSIEALLPSADVLLYDDSPTTLAGAADHSPDVVFVAPEVGGVDGPELCRRLAAGRGDMTIVGMVDEPDGSWSTRYVAAGAGLVVARPVDDLALRTAFRQRAGGIAP